MLNKQIAATVILTDPQGEKRFLMRDAADPLHFMITDIKEELTGLASVLECFKQELGLPVGALHLVELTNVQVALQQLPFFVFSLDSEVPLADEHYRWAYSKEFRTALAEVTITGSPLF